MAAKMSESDYAKMQARSAKERADLHPESVKYFLISESEAATLVNSAVPNIEKTLLYGKIVSRPAAKGGGPGLPYPYVEVVMIALANGICATVKAIIKGIMALMDYIER